MAIVTTDNAHYGDIAAAIREKVGGTALYKPAEMAAAILAIQTTSGGGASQIDSLIDRTITEISSNNVTKIGNYAFYGCSSLTTADFPVATSIGDYAFNNCSALTTADFPLATSIGTSAFKGCSELTTADFPAVTSIGGAAFNNCSALTKADFPAVTSIGINAFSGCYMLSTVNFQMVTKIDNSVFAYCSELTKADFPAVTSIGKSVFFDCSKLTTLILRSATMATLGNTRALDGTPIASGTGYIYVPAALMDSYKTATNWSVYANQIRAIEDYPDITGGAA